MSTLVKLAEATLFFLETLAWLAIAYVAFMLVGGGALGWLAGIGALVVVIIAWALVASPKGFLASRASVVAVRAVVYLAAVVGLIIVGPVWAGIALGVLLLVCEGLLIWQHKHAALTATRRTGRN
ncbi:DUF2568 domain-containing protein [Brevibacterium sp. p3-SID960]|uniref:DUF2568 domain-containing protein n=1 Tax=Brevibacterium sp. p3-SID960 TaxID=2916063 RepID=UPI0021A76AA7|nr:DUF2568 domain-containing protein [Brevibacterium sp. p3-SID960]MCT1691451.1 DUF2568 domain-containing protein [Brevibacterium sp. p3-SID960]